jgi:hypothetical protein
LLGYGTCSGTETGRATQSEAARVTDLAIAKYVALGDAAQGAAAKMRQAERRAEPPLAPAYGSVP